MRKKLTSIIFLFLLMIPTSIQLLHELENHEHVVCKAVGQQHMHQYNNDCDDFHKQLPTFSIDFTSNNDVIPKQFYSSIFINTSDLISEYYQSKKYSRAPPIVA